MDKKTLSSKLEIIKETVGTPYYEAPNMLLYKMDCSDFMDSLNTEVIDLTITSPPYNIGKEYEKKKLTQDYINWSQTWMEKVHRITKKNGAFWLNLGYLKIPKIGYAVPIPYLLWDKNSFYFMQEVVWHYEAGVTAYNIFSSRNEKYLWYVKNPHSYLFKLDAVRDKNVKYPNQKKNGIPKVNPKGKNPTNVWMVPKVTSGSGRSAKDRTSHPTQAPIQIIERIVKACSNERDVVFDPFLGSGTTALAAMQQNRLAVGCEINSKYLSVIKNRIQSWIDCQLIDR